MAPKVIPGSEIEHVDPYGVSNHWREGRSPIAGGGGPGVLYESPPDSLVQSLPVQEMP